MTVPFIDHFAPAAADYARYRPTYPAALYHWLAATTPARDVAWDVGTGSGQVARDLAGYFARVVASDASAEQIRQALPCAGVEFRCEAAEQSQLPDRSVDLVTVAQALHWFDLPRFFAETRRVLKPGGLLAVATYNLVQINPAIDACLEKYYHDIVGPYWPAERRLVETGYASIVLPGEELGVPAWQMTQQWQLRHLMGYLGTWSASIRYREVHGRDAREQVMEPLAMAWGNPEQELTVSWPLLLRVAKIA